MELSNFFLFALILLRELTTVLVLLHMVYKRREPSSMIAWLLFLIFVPYLAVVLYLIFGVRKVKSKYKKDNIAVKSEGNPAFSSEFAIYQSTTRGEMSLSFDYVDSYKIFERSIKEAKKSIYICTYIFQYDSVTKELLLLLEQKAKEGVEVKILMDSLGSFSTYLFQKRFQTLKKLGAQIHFFMPVFRMPFRSYINLRNHRKIYIFDNQKVLSGGINLTSEYFGKEYTENRWEDILFSCEGSCVESFFTIFASDWYYATNHRLTFDRGLLKKSGEERIKVLPSGPDVKTDVLYETLLDKIFTAKQRIWIVTPYFIPNETLSKALIIAKHKGVEVKLITPKHSDHFFADLTRSSFLRELQESHIDIMLYEGRMLHAKAILFDDTWVMAGSVNLDNRSLFLNYEVATFVSSDKSVATIEAWMKKLLMDSTKGVQKASHVRVLIENLMRIIAPQA